MIGSLCGRLRAGRVGAVLLASLVGIAAAQAASLTPAPAWHPDVRDLALPGGGTERALMLRPDHPRGTLVMLPGGDGEVGIGEDGTLERADNVVIRTAPLWLSRDWALLIPDAPGNLRGARASPGYGTAVSALVAEAHRAVTGPVDIVGTSQGAIAAVNGAAHAPDVSGLVLLEAVSRVGGSGETVFDADPAAVTAPVLVVANVADRCPVTPPEDADRIAAAFTGSRRVEVMRVDGGGEGSRDCGSLSPHGYRGLEREVVDRVSGWIGR